MTDARNADDAVRIALETACAYRLSDPHDREVLRRYILRVLRVVKAEGVLSSEEAFRLLQHVDAGTFRDLEAEQYLGLVKDTSTVEVYDVM